MVLPVVCERCGQDFAYDPARPNKRYCTTSCKKAVEDSKRSSDKNAARNAHRIAHRPNFVGVDGEGIDVWENHEVWDEATQNVVLKRTRTHRYVLVSVGDKSFHRDGEMLTHEDVFNFLWEQKLARPDAVFVGFFLGYDFSQWLKTLPASRAYSLLHRDGIAKRKPTNAEMKFPFPVYHRGWSFDLLGMRRFKLRPHVRKEDYPQCVKAHRSPEQIADCAAGKHNVHPHEWLYICDAGSFFQMSFMRAITEKWKPGTEIVSQEEIAILQAGKDNRSSATISDLRDGSLVKYNVLENDVLARLMNTVNEGFVEDGIRLKSNQWFGPGQAAQAWMKLIGLPTGNEIREECPTWGIEAARQSYYGGWFEIMMHGPVPGTTYTYDINSAYPHAIAQLPCLLHGTWTRGEGKPPRLPKGALQLIDARVVGRDPYIGAMPHRRHEGSIVRPHRTSGWYWQHEIDAARRAGVISQTFIDGWVRYEPCDCPPPVRAIADLYQSRLEVGKNSPYGKSKKLVYNSAYGKFAQSVGEPRFSNSVYASLITAGCRTMILDAIATHPEKTRAVAMVATDSVTFLTPHPTLDVSADELGKWDSGTYENLSLMMPGLYWDDRSREAIRLGNTPSLKSRGVSARDLGKFIYTIDRKWEILMDRRPDPRSGEIWWLAEQAPQVEIFIEFAIVSPKLAVFRDKWWECGMVLWGSSRKLSADPFSKRLSMYVANEFDRKIIRSHLWDEIPDEPRTYPYEKTFGVVLDDEMQIAEELLTPDGSIAGAYRNMLPGRI